MESEEIYLAQHSPGADDSFAVKKEVIAKDADESTRVRNLIP
jgi:hypothetical protein